jgi:hypothetical protein
MKQFVIITLYSRLKEKWLKSGSNSLNWENGDIFELSRFTKAKGKLLKLLSFLNFKLILNIEF